MSAYSVHFLQNVPRKGGLAALFCNLWNHSETSCMCLLALCVHQDGSSLSPPLSCRPEEISLELRKISGSLGLSITVSLQPLLFGTVINGGTATGQQIQGFIESQSSFWNIFLLYSIQACLGSNLPSGKIYIRSLVPGGAAERDGRLHTGNILYRGTRKHILCWLGKSLAFSILRQRLQRRRTKPPLQE